MTQLERLARVEEQVKSVDNKVDGIDKKLDQLIEGLDNRYASKYIEKFFWYIVGGMVTVCSGVIIFVINHTIK